MARKRKLVEVKCLARYWGRSVGSCSSAHSAPTGRTLSLLYPLPAKFGSGPCDQCNPHPWGSGSHLTPLHNRPLPLPVSPSPLQPPPPQPACRLRLLCPVWPQCPRSRRKPRGGAGPRAKWGGDFSERCPTRANRKRQ